MDHIITRNELEDNILEAFKDIHGNGGYILVHGIGGCGKTVAVCQALQRFVEKHPEKFRHSIRWISIG